MKKIPMLLSIMLFAGVAVNAQDTSFKPSSRTNRDSMPTMGDTTMHNKKWSKDNNMSKDKKRRNPQEVPLRTDSLKKPE